MFPPKPDGTPLLAFSTLACPEWGAEEVVDRAAAFGYDAIEWRGGPDGHVSTDWPAGVRRALHRRMADRGLVALAVTAYTTFVSSDPAVRGANAADLAAHLELARDLGAAAVRTFVGFREDAASADALVARVSEALAPVAERAAELGVDVVIEPHDDFVAADSVARILEAIDHPSVGAVWDVVNAWTEGERPEVGVARLGPWIRYVQLKDAAGAGDARRLTPIDEGEVPLEAALRLLRERGPLPPLCFEWERAWHEELAPAAEALGPGLAALRRLVGAVQAPASAGGRG